MSKPSAGKEPQLRPVVAGNNKHEREVTSTVTAPPPKVRTNNNPNPSTRKLLTTGSRELKDAYKTYIYEMINARRTQQKALRQEEGGQQEIQKERKKRKAVEYNRISRAKTSYVACLKTEITTCKNDASRHGVLMEVLQKLQNEQQQFDPEEELEYILDQIEEDGGLDRTSAMAIRFKKCIEDEINTDKALKNLQKELMSLMKENSTETLEDAQKKAQKTQEQLHEFTTHNEAYQTVLQQRQEEKKKVPENSKDILQLVEEYDIGGHKNSKLYILALAAEEARKAYNEADLLKKQIREAESKHCIAVKLRHVLFDPVTTVLATN